MPQENYEKTASRSKWASDILGGHACAAEEPGKDVLRMIQEGIKMYSKTLRKKRTVYCFLELESQVPGPHRR